MLLVFGTLFDPAADERLLMGRQGFVEIRGRHDLVGIVREDVGRIALSLGLPGTMACWSESLSLAQAPSDVSNRRSSLRVLASNPWQAKQVSEKIGRMWALKVTFSGRASAACGDAESALPPSVV